MPALHTLCASASCQSHAATWRTCWIKKMHTHVLFVRIWTMKGQISISSIPHMRPRSLHHTHFLWCPFAFTTPKSMINNGAKRLLGVKIYLYIYKGFHNAMLWGLAAHFGGPLIIGNPKVIKRCANIGLSLCLTSDWGMAYTPGLLIENSHPSCTGIVYFFFHDILEKEKKKNIGVL